MTFVQQVRAAARAVGYLIAATEKKSCAFRMQTGARLAARSSAGYLIAATEKNLRASDTTLSVVRMVEILSQSPFGRLNN